MSAQPHSSGWQTRRRCTKKVFLFATFILNFVGFPVDAKHASPDAAACMWLLEVCCVLQTRRAGGGRSCRHQSKKKDFSSTKEENVTWGKIYTKKDYSQTSLLATKPLFWPEEIMLCMFEEIKENINAISLPIFAVIDDFKHPVCGPFTPLVVS